MIPISKKAALYARVSTENQELDKQEKKLESWADRKGHEYELFAEKVSSIKERPKFEEVLERLDEFDVLAVTKIDRFGRSLQDTLQKLNTLKEHDVEFVTTDQPIDTEDEMVGDMMMKMLAIFAEFERKMIRKRLEEGYREALAQNKVGRPSKLSEEQKDRVAEMYENGSSYDYIKYTLDREHGVEVSDTTIYRALKDRSVIGNESDTA